MANSFTPLNALTDATVAASLANYVDIIATENPALDPNVQTLISDVFELNYSKALVDAILQTAIAATPWTTYFVSSNVNPAVAWGHYEVDANGGPITITLDDPANMPGCEVTIAKEDGSANAITVATLAGTINGVATQTIAVQYSAIRVYSTGAHWRIV